MLSTLCKYQSNDYFNNTDQYLIKGIGYTISKLHFNKYWFCNEPLNYKMTSIESIKCDEIVGREVVHRKTLLRGKINKFVNDSIGVYWLPNQNIKDKQVSYWNEFYDLMVV